MVKRKNIAINFFTDYKSATGLTIYLLNIINTLNSLDDSLKPNLTIIYTEKAPIQEIMALNYTYCNYYPFKYLKPNLLKRAVNKLSRLVFNKSMFNVKKLVNEFPNKIDLIYPYSHFEPAEYIKEKVYWKADFQEKYYPEFFPASDLKWSEDFLSELSHKSDVLVLSSISALNDYKKFYPNYKNEIKLLRFASFLPDFSTINIEDLLKKYGITKKYFFIANQFWPHKNHLTVLKALNEIREQFDCEILMSGNTSSYRDSNYFPSLLSYIEDNKLNDFVKILGFIDRKDQLQLMNNAVAIIQPSLFEGWSTVIEDAKAMNKLVIASNLEVNQEQAPTNAVFFESLNYKELSSFMLKAQKGEIKTEYTDYASTLDGFKQDIVNILNYS